MAASTVEVAVGSAGVTMIACWLGVASVSLSSPIRLDAQNQKRPSSRSRPTTGRITRR